MATPKSPEPAAVLSAVLSLTFLAMTRPNESFAGQRPNVVLIVADDQSFTDFGFMGNSIVQTPNLDALATRSFRIANGYVPASVCRPSLVTLLTGQYPHEHGVHFNHPPPGFAKLTRTLNREQFESARREATRFIRNAPSLPRRLAASGYRCLQTGKYWEGHWSNAGFTEGMTTGNPTTGAKYGNKQLANGQWVAHGNGDAGLAIGRETMEPIAHFLEDVNEQPFLIWYAPFLPHLPHDSPPQFHQLYDDSVAPADRAYYAACSQFDASVGALIEMVDRAPTRRPTLYVFVSDNGFRPDSSKPMRDGYGFNYTKRSKRSPFESGLRTPILLSMSGTVRERSSDAICSTVNLAPTILEACSVEIPSAISGESLWPLATGQVDQLQTQQVFGAIYPGDASELGHPECDVAYRWMREGPFKLIVPHRRGGQVWGHYGDRVQLYDLSVDPEEKQNLAANAKHLRTLNRLMKDLDRWWLPNTQE